MPCPNPRAKSSNNNIHPGVENNRRIMTFSYFNIKHLESRHERWQTRTQGEMDRVLGCVVIPIRDTIKLGDYHVCEAILLRISILVNGLRKEW